MVGKLRNWLVGYLDNDVMRENGIYSIADGMTYSIMNGLTMSFMGVFALRLGATDQMLGFLAAWPALMGLIAQIPSAIITERTDMKLRPLLAWCWAHRINYMFYAIIPFLPISGIMKAWVFIALVTWMNFPAVVVNTMWTQLMGEIFPIRYRGRIFGDRNFIVGWITLGSMLLAGPLLDYIPYPYNFGLLFFLAFLGLVASTYYLTKIKEVKVESAEIETTPQKRPFDGMKLVIKDKHFLSFTAASFIYYIGFNISASMWTILHVRVLLLSNTQIAMVSILSTIMATLSYRFWGRVSDQIGNKQVYFIACLLFLMQPWLHAYVNQNTLWLLWALSIANGLASGAFNLSQFNTLLSVAPNPAIRPSYMAFFNMAMQVTGFVFPMLGMLIFKSIGSQLNPIFYLSTMFRTVGLIYMAYVIQLKWPFGRRT